MRAQATLCATSPDMFSVLSAAPASRQLHGKKPPASSALFRRKSQSPCTRASCRGDRQAGNAAWSERLAPTLGQQGAIRGYEEHRAPATAAGWQHKDGLARYQPATKRRSGLHLQLVHIVRTLRLKLLLCVQ